MTDVDDWAACRAQACQCHTLDSAVACSFGTPWPAAEGPWVRWEACCNPLAGDSEASRDGRPGEGDAGLRVLRASRPGRHPRRFRCQRKAQERSNRPVMERNLLASAQWTRLKRVRPGAPNERTIAHVARSAMSGRNKGSCAL